jgi:hypothetical protein
MLKNKPIKSKDESSNHLLFSFAYALKGCGRVKNKGFFFTNQLPDPEIKKYRITIDNAFRD